MKKQSLISVVCLASCLSCLNVEDPSLELGTEKFIVTVDDEYTATPKNGDRLALFASNVKLDYECSAKKSSTEAIFVKKAALNYSEPLPYDHYAAFYPYRDDVSRFMEGRFRFTVPHIQKYVEGGYDSSAFPLVAVTQDLSSDRLEFSRSCALLKIAASGSDPVKSISLSGNESEALSGEALLDVGKNGVTKCFFPDEEASSDLTLDCGAGVEPCDFVIAVPPVTFNSGFKVVFSCASGESYTFAYRGVVELGPGTVHSVSAAGIDMGKGSSFSSFGLVLSDGSYWDCIDPSGPLITVCVPRGTDLTALKADFRHSGASVTIDGKKQTSGISVNDFSKAVTYKVTSSLGESATYTVNVIDVDLPVVYISTPGHNEVKDKKNWHLGSLCVIRMPDGTSVNYGRTGIKGRGNSSWNYAKKPYNIKFEERPQKQNPAKEDVLGMPGHKRWCLLSNCMGYFYGNQTGYELGRRSSMEWSPHARFVELVLNGKHLGLYSLVEQVRIDKCRIDIKEMDANDITEDKITGGYLLSYDTTMDEPFKFRSSGYNMPVMVKSPDDDDITESQFQYIQDYINNMEASLKDNARFAAREYLNYLDPDTFIGAWMTKELASRKSLLSTTATDFTQPRSVFYYKDRGGVLKAGPAWDFDVHLLVHQPKFFCTKAQYYDRLFQDQEFVSRAKQLWPEMKSKLDGGSGYKSLTDYVDSLYNVSAYSAARDEKMWKSIWTRYPYYTAAQQRDLIKSAMTQRIVWMDEEMKKL